MKLNKWTLGLAAVGAVSMASAVRADEAKLSALNTAISGTTISGYVDVAAQYNFGDPSGIRGPVAYNQPAGLSNGKIDNFSVNNVTISLDKALDESPWASGYHIDLNAGSDAITPLNSGLEGGKVSAVGIRQGYVTLRTPVGNGIDWKVGLFDGVTGYESNTGYANPNYTRSFGYQVNPASEAGAIGSYNVTKNINVQLGLGNRLSGTSVGLSSHDYIAAVALTAPDSWGFLKGSVLNFGTVQTFDNGGINNYNVNATLNTPVTGLKVGLSYDIVQSLQTTSGIGGGAQDGNIYGVYANYQATQKLGLNLRAEYLDSKELPYVGSTYYYWYNVYGKAEEVTATVQYDLWANVVSRLEVRWDHAESGLAYNSNGNSSAKNENAFLVALNLVYKF